MILYPPHPAIDHLVSHVGIGRADAGVEAANFEYYPDGHADLLLQLTEANCELLLFGPARNRASLRMRAGRCHILVRFRPGRFPRDEATDPSALVDGVARLDRLFGYSAAQWGEALQKVSSPAACQRLLMERLLETEASCPSPPEAGRAYIDWIARSHGMTALGEFAAASGCSQRQLQRYTRELVGLAPKTLARNLRLQWILDTLHPGQTEPLTDLAYSAGFCDQPHFIRDFKSLTGKTPGDHLADRRPIPWMIFKEHLERSALAPTVHHLL